MRILYLTHTVTWTGGGIFYTAYHQGRKLAERGHEVTLVSISPDNHWGFSEHRAAGIRLVEAPDMFWGRGRTGWDPSDAIRRMIRFGSDRFDLIHGYESRPVVALPGLYLSQRQHVPLVFTWADWFGRGGKGKERGRWLRLLMDPLETLCEDSVYPRADGCIAMGEPLMERAKALGIPQGRLVNMLHGCDVEGLSQVERDAARRQMPALPERGFVLGYLGALRSTSAEVLFEAFRLIRQNVNQAVKLVLIGNSRLDLSRYVPESIREDVIETGWLSYREINLCLAACDILLLPLKRAIATDYVWPSKLNDYLAAGRPTVATSMRILEPVFNQHQVGLLTRDEPEDFAQGCVQLLRDEAGRRQMAANARNLAEGELSWNHLAGRLESFYETVLAAPR